MAGSFQFLRGVPMFAFFSPGNKPGTVAGRYKELEWQAHVTFFHHGDRRCDMDARCKNKGCVDVCENTAKKNACNRPYTIYIYILRCLAV